MVERSEGKNEEVAALSVGFSSTGLDYFSTIADT
jgi:hypothetical protein